MVEQAAGLIRRAHAVLDRAVEEYKPAGVYAMFSGGHDSLAATAATATHPAFTAAVHINTGIGIEQTREFVRETCRERGWTLFEYGPPETIMGKSGPNRSYEDMVLRWGFPGPPQHKVMYSRLKERVLRQFVRDHRKGEAPVLFSTGIRLEESVRRMRNYADTTVGVHGGMLWANPIETFSKADCLDVLDALGLRRNEVVDLLHMSGECLCGAFARPDEMHDLETWFPETAAYLHELERRVEAAGRIGCVWGRRTDDVHREQLRLLPILPLCTSCQSAAASV